MHVTRRRATAAHLKAVGEKSISFSKRGEEECEDCCRISMRKVTTMGNGLRGHLGGV